MRASEAIIFGINYMQLSFFFFLFLDIMESPTFKKLGDLLENLFEFDDECDAPSFHDLGKSYLN